MSREEKLQELLSYHHMLNIVGSDGEMYLVASDGKNVYCLKPEEAAKYKVDPSTYCLKQAVGVQIDLMYNELEAKKTKEVQTEEKSKGTC